MTREIPLTKGFVALVDDSDYQRVNAFKWCVSTGNKGGTYAVRREGRAIIRMHRAILDAAAGMLVDHINGDTLDNRRANLRLCDHATSALNRRGYGKFLKGVERKRNRFRARISIGGRLTYLGWFSTEVEAGMAYDEAARRLHGQFARLNFPDGHVLPPLEKEDGRCSANQIGALVTP